MATSYLEQEELKLRRIREEQVARAQQRVYQLDPMAWLEERFGEDRKSFQWSLFGEGYEKHKWDGDKDPLYSAWMSLTHGRWAAVEAGTGTSKTYWLARVVLWFLDVFPNSLVVTSAPKQAQLTLNLWSEVNLIFHKFKKIRPKAAMYNLRLVVEDEDANKRENEDEILTSKSWHAVGFVAGVGSLEESATKAQGFHRENMLIIVEETPGMPQPVLTAFYNTCTGSENNLVLAVGNPDNRLDPLHLLAESPNADAYRVSAYDYPNVVLGKEVFKGAASRASIRRRLLDYGKGSAIYKSRVRGISPAQSAESLIQMEWIEAAIAKGKEPILSKDDSYNAVGVDVANSESGDKAATAWGEANILRKLQEFYCPNANHLAYNLIYTEEQMYEFGIQDYETDKIVDYGILDSCIGVDTVGVGVATINTLSDQGYEATALIGGQWEEAIAMEEYYDNKTGELKTRPKWRFQTLRSQMYWELREDLRMGRLIFALEGADPVFIRTLIMELTIIRVRYKDNFIAVEPKEEIKKRMGGKSPNRADATVYWNWVRKAYRMGANFIPVVG